jgi:predicted transcriptional regulator
MGELERAVLEILWDGDEGPVTVRHVHQRLAASRRIAYTTVMTVLDRLTRKGLVTQHRDVRAFRYSPGRSREELTADLMHEVLEEFAVGDSRVALVRFVDRASPDEIRALREALAQLESR